MTIINTIIITLTMNDEKVNVLAHNYLLCFPPPPPHPPVPPLKSHGCQLQALHKHYTRKLLIELDLCSSFH